jgi:hypothetical protein
VATLAADRAQKLSRLSVPIYGLLLLGAIGFLIRIVIVLLSSGSNDIVHWANYAAAIDENGVAYMYENVPRFNHPPLMGYLAAFCLRVAQALDIRFAVVFKLPMIVADALGAILLWKIWSESKGLRTAGWSVAAFGLSLTAILVGTFHGNTDNLSAFFILLSAYFCQRRMPLAGGLALAAALNVKLIPLVVVPAFVLRFQSWREMFRFCSGLAVGIVPFIPFLLCCAGSFYKNAITYNSDPNRWGIIMFLHFSEDNVRLDDLARDITAFYIPSGRYVVMGAVILLSIWAHLSNRWTWYEMGAMSLALFFILTPGFAVQYAVYIVPILFAVSVRWATWYSVLAGLFIGLVYLSFWTGDMPFHSQFRGDYPMPGPLFGLLAWGLLIQFVASRLRGSDRHIDPVRENVRPLDG